MGAVVRRALAVVAALALAAVALAAPGPVAADDVPRLGADRLGLQGGWAVDDGENSVDIRCVAVALGGGQGVDAISCSAPKSRMDDARLEEVAQAVTEAAHSLSTLLKRLGPH